MLAPQTIDRYARSFFGYGNLAGPIWFVGMEEGGLRRLEEFERRVDAWTRLGSTPLVDLAEFSRQIGVTQWFDPDPPLQKTWRALIRTVLVAKNGDPSLDSQRWYQAHRLGRRDGEIALLELLPFPSASTRDWPYAQLGIPSYSSREAYRGALTRPRLASILGLIEAHQPRIVVCYGNARFWRQHLSLSAAVRGVSSGRAGRTAILATNHPTARGSTNVHWDTIGLLVREEIG